MACLACAVGEGARSYGVPQHASNYQCSAPPKLLPKGLGHIEREREKRARAFKRHLIGPLVALSTLSTPSDSGLTGAGAFFIQLPAYLHRGTHRDHSYQETLCLKLPHVWSPGLFCYHLLSSSREHVHLFLLVSDPCTLLAYRAKAAWKVLALRLAQTCNLCTFISHLLAKPNPFNRPNRAAVSFAFPAKNHRVSLACTCSTSVFRVIFPIQFLGESSRQAPYLRSRGCQLRHGPPLHSVILAPFFIHHRIDRIRKISGAQTGWLCLNARHLRITSHRLAVIGVLLANSMRGCFL